LNPELVGWASALILLVTMAGQIRTQWKSGSVQGVSPWLFWGQVAASAGFVAYSLLVDNVVFAITNGVLLANALLGQVIYARIRDRNASASAAGGSSR
jgi:MtN3 and saliva related transmembrane protein